MRSSSKECDETQFHKNVENKKLLVVTEGGLTNADNRDSTTKIMDPEKSKYTESQSNLLLHRVFKSTIGKTLRKDNKSNDGYVKSRQLPIK